MQPTAPTHEARPKIAIVARAAIADDPRPRRQGDAFATAGWDVVGIGLPGGRAPPPDWPVVDRAAGSSRPQPPAAGPAARLGRALRYLLVRIIPALAIRFYRSLSPESAHLYACGRTVRAAIWLANDWDTLPVAARLAAEQGGVYGYDANELAGEEFSDRRRWRLFNRPFVRAIEAGFIGTAAVVSAESPGIAAQLTEVHRLPRPALAIRNTPSYEAHRARPTGPIIEVLYHGKLVALRGLEQTIDSVASWRPEFRLTLRGPGEPAYVEALRRRAAAAGVTERVRFAAPVPLTELVAVASDSDIGLFALPGSSLHHRLCLPNKVFEYIMAALCLCVSDLPEMGRLVRQHDVGRTFPAVEAGVIAAAINGFDRESIDRCKTNAAVAARSLCWERESEALVAAYRGVLGVDGRRRSGLE